MANKFTKLNIGEAVASGSGRAWKKLTTEEIPVNLVRLLTSDGNQIVDSNGVIITTKV